MRCQILKFADDLLPARSHPNYELWRSYLITAEARGELAAIILKNYLNLTAARILDIGCGVGGATLALARLGTQVSAIDLDASKLACLSAICQQQNLPVNIFAGSFLEMDFGQQRFNGAILQDVIEHVANVGNFLARIANVLLPDGVLFMSTPNRWSPINFGADPHWHLPIVSVLNRPLVKFFISRFFRRTDGQRTDLPVLLSLKKLTDACSQAGLSIKMENARVCHLAVNNPHYVMNARAHLVLMRWLRRMGLSGWICKLVNDQFGIFNNFLNPTWYLIAHKTGAALFL